MTKPPKNLSRAGKQLWKQITTQFQIDDAGGLKILEVSLMALDRAEACRAVIDSEGLTQLDRFDQPKPHALLSTGRDCRAQFLAGIRQLSLDLEPVGRIGRPPSSGGKHANK